jgi:enamine deaminase RidA (YjgF/YER057c/UK114 family)
VAGAPARAAVARRAVALPTPPAPTAQYVPAVTSGRLLFVSGHDPEAKGRLVYRGRVGRDLSVDAAGRAVRLATANALASACAAVGDRRRLRRCVTLTCFVDATEDALHGPGRRPASADPVASPLGLLARALRLIQDVLGPAPPPLVWLRWARGLAGGMPVEVELLLELEGQPDGAAASARSGRKRGRRVSPRAAGATRRGRPRSGRRTS